MNDEVSIDPNMQYYYKRGLRSIDFNLSWDMTRLDQDREAMEAHR